MRKNLTNLRSWLRQSPQPVKLLVRTDGDQEHVVELSPNARNRWKNAEESIRSLSAVSVACLDKEGSVLRSHALDPDDDEGDPEGSELTKRRNYEKALLASEHKSMALMLDRYGDRLNEAFERGVAAASSQQDHLTGLVETLTGHLSTSITNLHAIAVNFANALADSGSENGGSSQSGLIGQLIAAKLAGAGGPFGGAQQAQQHPNGKRPRKGDDD